MSTLSKSNPRKLLIAGMALLAVCGLTVGGISLASGSSENNDAAFTPPASATGQLATAPDAASLAAFSIMRRPRTEADNLPSSAVGGLSSASGANLALARKAEGFTADEAWVIPGIGNECLWAKSTTGKNGGATCDGDASATAGELMIEAESPSSPGKVFIAGLVPDGISSVAVRLVGGSTDTLPVHENVYMQEITGEPESVAVGPSQLVSAAMPAK